MKPANPKWLGVALIVAFLSIDLAARLQNGNTTITQDNLVTYIAMVAAAFLIFLKLNSRLSDLGDEQADARLTQLWQMIVKIVIVVIVLFSIIKALKLL